MLHYPPRLLRHRSLSIFLDPSRRGQPWLRWARLRHGAAPLRHGVAPLHPPPSPRVAEPPCCTSLPRTGRAGHGAATGSALARGHGGHDKLRHGMWDSARLERIGRYLAPPTAELAAAAALPPPSMACECEQARRPWRGERGGHESPRTGADHGGRARSRGHAPGGGSRGWIRERGRGSARGGRIQGRGRRAARRTAPPSLPRRWWRRGTGGRRDRPARGSGAEQSSSHDGGGAAAAAGIPS